MNGFLPQRGEVVPGLLLFLLALLALPLNASFFAAATGVAVLAWFYRRRQPVQLAALRPALGFLLGVLACGLVASVNFPRSLQGIGKLLPAFFFLAGWFALLRDGRLVHGGTFRGAALIAGVLATLLLLASQAWFGGYLTRHGGLVDIHARNALSVSLLLVTAALLACWLARRRHLWLLLALLVVAALFANNARGAFLASAGILALAVLLFAGLKARHILLLGVAGALAAAMALWYFGVPDALNRPGENNFLNGRDVLWLGALQVVQDHPWFGIGINTWKYSTYIDALTFGPTIRHPSPHNVVLDLLASVGIVGCALLALAIRQLVHAVRRWQPPVSPELRLFGLLLLCGYLTNALLDFRVFNVQSLVVYAVAISLLASRTALPGPAGHGVEAPGGK